MYQKHSTDLQAPDVANLVVLLDFWDGGRRGNVPSLEFEPTLISKMQQAYEAEARANLGKLLSWV